MSKRLAWLLTGNLRTNMLVWVTIVVCYVLFPRRLLVPCGGSVPIATRSLSLLSALFKRLLLWVAFWTLVSLPSFTSFFFLAWLSSLVPYYPFPPACLYCLHDPWIPPSLAALCSLTDPDWNKMSYKHICCHSLIQHLKTFEDFTFLLSFPDASAQSVLLWTVRHRVNHWRTSLFSISFKLNKEEWARVIIYSNSFLFMLIKSSGAISQLSLQPCSEP